MDFIRSWLCPQKPLPVVPEVYPRAIQNIIMEYANTPPERIEKACEQFDDIRTRDQIKNKSWDLVNFFARIEEVESVNCSCDLPTIEEGWRNPRTTSDTVFVLDFHDFAISICRHGKCRVHCREIHDLLPMRTLRIDYAVTTLNKLRNDLYFMGSLRDKSRWISEIYAREGVVDTPNEKKFGNYYSFKCFVLYAVLYF